MNKIINKRIQLEKKYCNICLYNKFPLQKLGNRVLSVSPGNFFYHTRINANKNDIKEYKRLSSLAHFGERLKLEEETLNILDLYKAFPTMKYFFEIKNEILNLNFNELNKILQKKKLKTLKKYKFNRLLKLLHRWTSESVKCHYKITGAKKRLHKKYSKKGGIKC